MMGVCNGGREGAYEGERVLLLLRGFQTSDCAWHIGEWWLGEWTVEDGVGGAGFPPNHPQVVAWAELPPVTAVAEPAPHRQKFARSLRDVARLSSGGGSDKGHPDM